ncbi:MAG TPA: class I SAM-dependent methyltransferase [Gemmatimonadaceae bacterium]|nr:class I SAM-dependent methyltransferase [Gemmatimonadaceae bacterium]
MNKPTVSEDPSLLKQQIKEYWEAEPCGTRGVEAEDRKRFFDQIERERYEWEPYIPQYAKFDRARGKRLLEIGVGAGTDFINWVRHGAIATGVDLTDRGVNLTRERLGLEGLTADVRRADAENLPFEDNSFDVVYSNGVLHVPPNPARAIAEAHRVLKPGGTFVGLIYNVHSWVGFMLWGVHCLAKGRPWKGPRWAIYHYLESPGTNAYTVRETRELFSRFSVVDVRTQLGHGDLLLMRPGAKYNRNVLYRLLWRLWPRWLIRRLGNRFGMAMIIEAVK